MSIYRQLLLFSSVCFLLCAISSIFIGLMHIGFNSFQALYLYFDNWMLIVPPIGFFILSYLVRQFAPQSDGAGYLDVSDLLENKAQSKVALNHEIIPTISYRDFLARFFLTPLGALSGGSLGLTGPMLHMASAFILMFDQKLRIDKNTLIYCAVICCLTTFFGVLLTGLVFYLESTYRTYLNHKKSSKQAEDKGKIKIKNIDKNSLVSALIRPLPFIFLSLLIAIFWKQTIGDWHFSLPPIHLDIDKLIHLNWFNFLILTTLAAIFALIFRFGYHQLSKTMVQYWKIQSIVCGLLISLLIYSFGSKLVGSGAIFLNPDMIAEYQFWQKWLANFITISSGISAGMVIPTMAIGSLLSYSLSLPLSIGVATFLATAIKRPLTSGFLVSEFLNLALVETLIGAIFAYWLLKFFDTLITKLSTKINNSFITPD